MAVTLGYTGATGRDIGFGGTNSTAININQIDPAVARAAFPGPGGTWDAAALSQSIPNPFFGVAGAGEFGDARDDPARPAPAAVPAVRRHPHVRSHRRREAAVPCR